MVSPEFQCGCTSYHWDFFCVYSPPPRGCQRTVHPAPRDAPVHDLIVHYTTAMWIVAVLVSVLYRQSLSTQIKRHGQLLNCKYLKPQEY
ncbi:hypothetical protein KUTeg_003177 [Tegillarca granosa]|uniref:Uncharacterized protein n=1 Tax=Tegillarca granosa TaxID=220873 RepID=A0ABQ9FPK5_TEGGR|nr:hypothetical protein KUTeg_003177 [Tegillarca granosa]